MDEERLAHIPLFASLSKRNLEEVAASADVVEVPEGRTLMTEGRFAYEFCVIENGGAEVLHDGKPIAHLGPGDFAGEMGALSGGRRNASVVTTSASTLIVMTASKMREMNDRMPSVAIQLAAAVEERSEALAALAGLSGDD